MTYDVSRRAFLAAFGATTLAPAFFANSALAEPARPTPQQFAKTPKVEHIALSPDAKRLAYVTSEGTSRVMILIDIANNKADKVPLGSYKLRDFFWASPKHIVFETSVTTPIRPSWRTNEYYQAHVFNIDNGKVFTLFEGMDDFLEVTYGNFNIIKRGDKYSLTAVNEMKSTEAFTIFEFDLDTKKSRIVDGGRSGTEGWVLRPDGTLAGRANIDFKQATKRFWFLEMFIDGKWQEIYRKEILTETPSLIGISRDGDKLIVYLNEEGKGGTYHEIDSSGTISAALFEGNVTRYPTFHPTTKRMCGYIERGDWPTYHYDDATMAGIYSACADLIEPGERFSRVDYAEDPRKTIVYTEGPNNAGGYFYADFTSGDIIPILQARPDIAPEWISDKKPITYTAADGLQIPAYLTLPPFKAAKDLPLIVLVHGGPQSRDTLSFDWEAQAYASMGYAVLQANYRGSSGYGWDFMAAGFGEYGRKMQTDLSDGVRHLVKLGIVDARRVAIAGASYGGYAALAGATIDRGVYRCAIDVAGVSDPEFFYLNTNFRENESYRWRKRMLGDGNLAEISPLKNADKAEIPILIIHGEDDTVVTIEESNRMVAALKKAGKEYQFLKLKKEDHWESVEPKRLEKITAIATFLQKHNPA